MERAELPVQRMRMFNMTTSGSEETCL